MVCGHARMYALAFLNQTPSFVERNMWRSNLVTLEGCMHSLLLERNRLRSRRDKQGTSSSPKVRKALHRKVKLGLRKSASKDPKRGQSATRSKRNTPPRGQPAISNEMHFPKQILSLLFMFQHQEEEEGAAATEAQMPNLARAATSASTH